MAVSLSVVVAKDGAGTTIAGGLQAQDKSGAGTGPFTLGHVLIDGLAGVNQAAVTAANAVKVDGSAVTQPVSNAGTFAVQVSNANANGQATMANSAPVVIASNQSTLPVGLVPVTTGGCTISSTLIASGTNATSVKASAGQLYKVEITNNSANIAYLKLYNTAGTPTAGSGTPVIRLMVPGNASGAGAFSTYDNGIAFATGIGFTFTGGIADADTTSVAASAFIVNLYYK